jgi:hypothetical protein
MTDTGITSVDQLAAEERGVPTLPQEEREAPPLRLVRYTGVSGASVSNDWGTWNISAPDYVEGEEKALHPFGPLKQIPEDRCSFVDDHVFIFDDK